MNKCSTFDLILIFNEVLLVIGISVCMGRKFLFYGASHSRVLFRLRELAKNCLEFHSGICRSISHPPLAFPFSKLKRNWKHQPPSDPQCFISKHDCAESMEIWFWKLRNSQQMITNWFKVALKIIFALAPGWSHVSIAQILILIEEFELRKYCL